MVFPTDNPVVLQGLNLCPREEIELLHYRYALPGQGLPKKHDEQGLSLPAGTRIDFGTLFGSFYDADWFRHTELENVFLRLKIVGDFRAELFRKTIDGDVHRVGLAQADGSSVHTIAFNKGQYDTAVPARLWAVVDALSDITLEEVSWVTTDEPVRKEFALGVCFATFNRIPYLKRVLNDLLSDQAAIGGIAKIVLVNQGEKFTLEELLEPNNKGRGHLIKLVEQGNFGGCGGFTRGLLEVLEDDGLTHALLCDDDIVFDPYSITRLSAFSRFCNDDVAVGGQMLDILRPDVLYESGAALKQESLTPRPLLHNLPLGEPDALDALIEPPAADYNGWWFFSLSKKLIRTVGLPMPCFIRGDDIEYGIRLGEQGVRTVVLPGLVVWHEPFNMKPKGWHYYYEVKNLLILTAAHFQRDIDRVLWQVGLAFLRDLMVCRYSTAKLAILALRDFHAGPEVAMTSCSAKLAELRELEDSYGPERMEQDCVSLPECSAEAELAGGANAALRNVRAFLYDLFSLSRGISEDCYIDSRRLDMSFATGKKTFIVRQPGEGGCLVFNRSWKLFVALLWQFFRIYMSVRLSHRRLANRYCRALAEYISVAHWHAVLGIDKISGAHNLKDPG